MSTVPVLRPDVVLRNYFHAKDENRPHILDNVFTQDAVLEIQNDSTVIAFPAQTVGRAAIGDVLVRSFCQTYENVYSFYLSRPAGELSFFECEWLVCMTEKSSRTVRVGCGLYRWDFAPRAPRLAQRLTIRIATMRVLPPSETQEVFARVLCLSYPWSSRAEAASAIAGHAELTAVLQTLPVRERDA
jgi:hypothetical protein